MAMLAEPRRKQRIGPNPRGKFFMEEEDNPGKQMLEKMGWKKGDGLGVGNKGMSEPICPKIQMSAKGLGFDVKSDPWVQHNQEFAEVLKKLNESHGDEDEDLSVDEKQGKHHLETRSKASRARIHYHKFVRGKDLSKASSTDLKSIFGNSTETFESISASVNKQVEPGLEHAVEGPQVEGPAQINRGSMADYFSKKLLEKKRKIVVTDECELVGNEDEKQADVGIMSEELASENNEPVKRKKAKKEKVILENSEAVVIPVKTLKKKRKKEMTADKDSGLVSIGDETFVEDIVNSEKLVEETEEPTKRNKSKKGKAVLETMENVETSVENFEGKLKLEMIAMSRKKTRDLSPRWKDLSKASSADLKSSFGTSAEICESISASVNKPPEPELESTVDGVLMERPAQINRGSMVDYFSKKLLERKRKIVVTDKSELVRNGDEEQADVKIKSEKVASESKEFVKRKKAKKEKVILENSEVVVKPVKKLKKKRKKEMIDDKDSTLVSIGDQLLVEDGVNSEKLAEETKEPRKRKKSKKFKAVLETTELVETPVENLEEKLKLEMIAMSRKKTRDLSPDTRIKICKQFDGSNLQKLAGYAFY